MANKKKGKATPKQNRARENKQQNRGNRDQMNFGDAVRGIAKAAESIGKVSGAIKDVSGGRPDRRNPLADDPEAAARAKAVVEKLTAAPETVIEHIQRVGGTVAVRKVYWLEDYSEKADFPTSAAFADALEGPLLCFLVPYDELARNEAAYLSDGGLAGDAMRQVYVADNVPPQVPEDPAVKPYFQVDGRAISTDGGDVVLSGKLPGWQGQPIADGTFRTSLVDGTGKPLEEIAFGDMEFKSHSNFGIPTSVEVPVEVRKPGISYPINAEDVPMYERQINEANVVNDAVWGEQTAEPRQPGVCVCGTTVLGFETTPGSGFPTCQVNGILHRADGPCYVCDSYGQPVPVNGDTMASDYAETNRDNRIEGGDDSDEYLRGIQG